MLITTTLNKEPGKNIILDSIVITQKAISDNGDAALSISWDTQNILTPGKWCRIESEKDNGYALVTNPYFIGAYEIPSFETSVFVSDTQNVTFNTRTFRFKNVNVQMVEDETAIKTINDRLAENKHHYYSALGVVKRQPELQQNYWHIGMNSETGVVEVFEAQFANTEADLKRYNVTGNYYVTREDAERAAEEYNSMIL